MALFEKYTTTPATPATVATLIGCNAETVATVATVATHEKFISDDFILTVASVATVAGHEDFISPHDLPHYCQPGDCWCSEKLLGSDYPASCVRCNCEYLEVTA